MLEGISATRLYVMATVLPNHQVKGRAVKISQGAVLVCLADLLLLGLEQNY